MQTRWPTTKDEETWVQKFPAILAIAVIIVMPLLMTCASTVIFPPSRNVVANLSDICSCYAMTGPKGAEGASELKGPHGATGHTDWPMRLRPKPDYLELNRDFSKTGGSTVMPAVVSVPLYDDVKATEFAKSLLRMHHASLPTKGQTMDIVSGPGITVTEAQRVVIATEEDENEL